MMKRFLSLLSAICFFSAIYANDSVPKLGSPLNIPLYLSGNFGELRTNHFHSGIDLKTQGRTGLPVFSVDDGYVSRIVVSPTGFGRAVYVTHPATGLTSVYGHLQSFSKKIDVPVRKIQYEKENFNADISFTENQIPVKRGEQIGLSGNAGSSGGPHLHLDIRDTETGDALDPIPYFKSMITDKVAPMVHNTSLYPVPGKGIVNSKSSVTTVPMSASHPGFTAWGEIIPAIKAYDKMSNTSNIYGIKYLTLFVDGKPFYERIIDRVDLSNTKAVNTLVDYDGVVKNNSWTMWTLIPKSEPLDKMVRAVNNGILVIDQERDYPCLWIVTDEYGNSRRIPFVISGQKEDIREVTPDGDLLKYDGHNTIDNPGIKVDFDSNTFYDDYFLTLRTDTVSRFSSPVFTIGSPSEPICKDFTVIIDIPQDTISDKDKYVMVRVRPNRLNRVDARYSHGKMIGTPGALGSFAVTVDDTAPTIKPLNPASWNKGHINFRISDNLSGIKEYRGEIDGKYALFELDAKTGRVSFVMDPSRFDRGIRHDIDFSVTDLAGNKSTYKGNFNW